MLKKGGIEAVLLIVLAFILLVGGVLLSLNKKVTAPKEDIVVENTPAVAPPQEPTLTLEQQEALDEFKEAKTADECAGIDLKEQCYLKMAVDKKDITLCEKITFERYKKLCLEQAK